MLKGQFAPETRAAAEKELAFDATQFQILLLSPVLCLAFLGLTDIPREIIEVRDAHPDDEAALKAAEDKFDHPDRLLERPDVPPMYRFEDHCQEAALPFPTARISRLIEITEQSFSADGVITAGIPELEPGTMARLEGMKEYNLISVGYDPREAGGTEEIQQMNNPQIPTDDGRVKRFMDEMLETYGSKSVAYIRCVMLCPHLQSHPYLPCHPLIGTAITR